MKELIQMRLQPGSFAKIKNGAKDIELRLYDEKRRLLKIGDQILFVNLESEEQLLCKIVGLCWFQDFRTLVENLGALRFGWDTEYSDADIEKYYSRDDVKKYGALGIVLSKE